MSEFLSLAFSLLLFGLFNVANSVNVITVSQEKDWQISNKYLNNDTLLMAQVIYRHGDRNIAKIYPRDPYKDEKHWPNGIGQLTNEGKRQHYKLGQYFRRRYGQILGDKYSANKVYVQSTDVERTLMSAQANLASLFSPVGEEVWNTSLNWQPIGVHTIPQSMDYVLYASKECPKYKIAYENYLKESAEVQRIYREHGDLFSFLTEKSGTNITTITDVYWLYNTLHIEKDHNKTLPQWVHTMLQPNGIMEYIATFDFKTYTDTPLLARLKSGFLFKKMLERFSQKANATLQPDRSLWFYSAHDITITNILNSLKLYKEILKKLYMKMCGLHIPNYASSLHFELFKTTKNNHYVQIFYRNLQEEILTPMYLPKCGTKCSLSQLYAIYGNIIPEDFETECYAS